MKYALKKINNKVITPIEVHHPNVNEILGHELIPSLNSVVFACGRKGSGKTNIIKTLMDNCINKNTKVIVFCATVYLDKNWLQITKWLEKREQPHVIYTTIFEDGYSNIEMLVDKIISDAQEKEQQKKDAKLQKKKGVVKKPIVDLFGDNNHEEAKEMKTKKSKMKAPEYFIVMDDMTSQLRKQSDVTSLLKIQRHVSSKIVIASQYPGDLDPGARAQIDIWCLYKGFGKDKIKDFFPQLDLRDIDFEDFYKIYSSVTATPHTFLYIDRNNNTLRKNFDQEIILHNIKENET